MKLFKSSILAIFALAAGASFTSCSDDEKIVEGGETGAYFISNDATIKLPDDGSDIVLTVARHSATDPKSIAVTFDDPSGIFSGASSVEFEGDALTTTYVVSYDNAAIEEDVNYQVNITLDAAQASHYGVYNYTPTFVRLSPWTSLGMATYTDEIVANIYNGVEPTSYEVEIQENDKTPGLYRLVNAYGAAFPYNEPGDWDTSKDYYIIIDATNPDAVNIGYTETGLNWGAGEVVFESRAQYYMDNGNSWEAVYNAGWFGTLKDGVITFPKQGFYSGMIPDYALPYWYGNSSGSWRVVMPGVVIADYSAEITYNGRLVAPDDTNSLQVTVALGEDVESARVSCVLGSTVDEIIAAMLADEVEYQEITETSELSFPVEKSGNYNIVVITYAGGEPQEAYSITQKVDLGGSDWETAGTAYVLDGWLLAGGGYTPSDYIWTVEYKTSASQPGLVKLVSLYGPETPLGNFALGNYDIVVDASNANYVIMEPQFTGNGFFEDGPAYISNGYMYELLLGKTPEEITAAGLNSTYDAESGIITVPANTCFINFGGEDWYRTYEEGAFQLVPGEQTPATKHVGVKRLASKVKGAGARLEHPATWGVSRSIKSNTEKVSTTMKQAPKL
ncbi:MAG: hypothetical protein ACI30S_08375 [Muribaculaceae bacterium]